MHVISSHTRTALLALLTAFLPAAALIPGGSEAREPASPQLVATASRPLDAVPGEVIVGYTDDLAISAAVDALGARAVERIDTLRAKRVALPPDVSIDDAIGRFRRTPGVAYAEPNIRLHAAALPNDPLYTNEQWYMDLLQAPQAWDRQTGDPNVIAAIIDTGVDATHEDLASRLWVNPRAGADGSGCGNDVHGCNFLSLSDERTVACGYTKLPPNDDISDDASHGTQVAGVLAAAGNNSAGMVGMAWNVRLMIVKAMDCQESGSGFDVAKAIDYATENGARIINLSLGGPNRSSLLTSAIDRAAGKGVLIFAAVGNSDSAEVDFPARLPNVIAVGASGDRASPDKRAQFSSWGPEVSLAAPGIGIMTTSPKNGYRAAAGTSFSAPLVAGVAALVLSQNPTLTGSEVRDILQRSAQPLPDGDAPNWDGFGRVRAAAALDRVPSTFAGTVKVNGAPAQPKTRVEGYIDDHLCGSTDAFSFPDGTTRYALRVSSAAAQAGCGTPGAKVRLMVAGAPAGLGPEWKGTLQALDLNVVLPVEAALDLMEGWNLVALPVNPLTTSLQQILGPVIANVEVAITFDAAEQKFLFYVPNSPTASTFSELRLGQGMWLRARAPTRLTLRGVQILPGLQIPLSKGLNMVGLSLPGPMPVELALKSLESKYIAVFSFTGGADGRFIIFISGGPVAANTLTQMEPGKGYWIVMDSAAVLSPPPVAGGLPPSSPYGMLVPTTSP